MKNRTTVSGHEHVRARAVALLAMLSIAAALAACGGGKAADPGVGTAPSASPTGSSADATSPAASDPNAGAATPPAADAPPAPPPLPTATIATDYVPLFAAGTPVMEQIQYTEPDGTLVTRAGFRPTNRHARERGEDWADPDVGPGNYFTFPPLYFQNRTMGLLIRDGVPAGRSTLDIYQVVNNGTWIRSGISAFRRNDPDVRAYGWKYNQGFRNTSDAYKNFVVDNDASAAGRICLSTSQPLDCYMDLPITSNWLAPTPNTPLKAGDLVEMSPAGFLDYVHVDGNEISAKIDGGNPRFYSFEQLYVVGKGMVPWYGTDPILFTTPVPDSALSGGMASVSYNYSEEPMRVFQQTVNNIGITDMQRFVEGRRLFHTSFADGAHSENPTINPPLLAHANQLGPRFNSERCLGCHSLNGRSPLTLPGSRLNTFAVLTASASSSTAVTPDPTYGLSVQQLSTDAAAPDYSVTVKSYQTTTRTLSDGEVVELQKPVYDFKGPVPAQFSVRQAPQIIGMGLLEAVDEVTILQLADPDDRNGDGVRGIPNWAIDPETGQKHLGRFGWKAGKGSVRQQIAGAFMLDMGVTTPVFPSRSCQHDMSTASCKTPPQATAGVSESELQKLSHYLQLIGVPSQRSVRSGFMAGVRVSAEHDVDPVRIANGARLFGQAGCTACHVAQMKTGNAHPFAELRNQVIHPYTDLLLHDMGAGLADTLTEGHAQPAMWRTQPLWGIGSLPYVQETAGEINGPDLPHGAVSNARYLHDGRARTLTEAILWHDGEARAARLGFEALASTQRADVLLFLGSL